MIDSQTLELDTISVNRPSEGSTVSAESMTLVQTSRDIADSIPVGIITGIAASAFLAACGGGGSNNSAQQAVTNTTTTTNTTTNITVVSVYQYTAPASDEEAARFLQHATFSSTTAEITDLRSKAKYADWLVAAFGQAQGQTGWDWMNSRGYNEVNGFNYFQQAYPAEFAIWSQLASAPDALRKRTALALSEFFVTSFISTDFNWRCYAMVSYWDTLVQGSFSNFRDLLEVVTLHPMMGQYLNTRGNQKANSATGRVPDENYAREVMQLFTVGVYQLNIDGSIKTDSAGNKLETYVQSDVTQLSRIFTGYNFDYSDGARLLLSGTLYIETNAFARKTMALDTSLHSPEAATFLGTTIAGGQWPQARLKQALDVLFNHPNVGPFFARQMIQRLVTSNPSPAYISRVASKFNDNGAGVRGDLKAVWSAILLDDEARSPSTAPTVAGAAIASTNTSFGKLREPMLRFVHWARSFEVTSSVGSWKIYDLSDVSVALGQSPFRAQSVFNYFRPGFVPPATAMATRGATAPEFQLANEITLGGYLNFMQDIIRNGINVWNASVPQAIYTAQTRDIQANYAPELALVLDSKTLVASLALKLCAGQLSAATQATMATALDGVPLTAASTASAKLDRVAAAILMVMACPEYLIQK